MGEEEMGKMQKMIERVEERAEDGNLEQFESEAEILQEIGIDLSPDELKIVNELMFVVHKNLARKEALEFMYR